MSLAIGVASVLLVYARISLQLDPSYDLLVEITMSFRSGVF